MKIAYVVSDLTFPAREGLHQQTIELVRQLCLRGNDVTLLGYRRPTSLIDWKSLQGHLGDNVTIQPFDSYRGSSALAAIRRLATRRLPFLRRTRVASQLAETKFEVAVFEGPLACIDSLELGGQSRVLSWVDPGSRRFSRLARNATSRLSRIKNAVVSGVYKSLERRLAGPETVWHVVSPSDAAYLRGRFPDQRIWAIPVMLPAEILASPDNPRRDTLNNRVEILIYADLRQAHLRRSFLRFAGDVAQRIDIPCGVRFVILGRVPEDAELAAALEGLSYEFIEWADDYIEVLRSADIVVLPDLDGTGLKNRAIQALALGGAVVGTSVAFEGIPVVHERDAFVYRDLRDMQVGIELLGQSRELRSEMGANARDFATTQFSASSVGASWDAHLATLVRLPD